LTYRASEAAIPFTSLGRLGDAVAGEVRWAAGPDIGRLQGTPVRLKLDLRDARVYGFQFGDP
jgi:hypothetical protein